MVIFYIHIYIIKIFCLNLFCYGFDNFEIFEWVTRFAAMNLNTFTQNPNLVMNSHNRVHYTLF
jgi:hypothetical protein